MSNDKRQDAIDYFVERIEEAHDTLCLAARATNHLRALGVSSDEIAKSQKKYFNKKERKCQN